MFYITVSNGLLKDGHRKRMGSSVWEFMWCIDKVTKVDDKGRGWVLGGKPIQLADLSKEFDVDEDTVSRNLHKLEEEGYITLQRTPYGIRIWVVKTKKTFGKTGERNRKSAVSITNRKSAVSNRENAVSNKTEHKDNTEDNTADEQSSSDIHIPEIIKLFENINSDCKTYYGNKTQRGACKHLIDNYGFERVKAVVETTLPKTNQQPFFPVITTPFQLKVKWASLESAILKYRNEKVGINKKYPVAIRR